MVCVPFLAGSERFPGASPVPSGRSSKQPPVGITNRYDKEPRVGTRSRPGSASCRCRLEGRNGDQSNSREFPRGRSRVAIAGRIIVRDSGIRCRTSARPASLDSIFRRRPIRGPARQWWWTRATIRGQAIGTTRSASTIRSFVRTRPIANSPSNGSALRPLSGVRHGGDRPEETDAIRSHLQRQHVYGPDRFRRAIEAQLGRTVGPRKIERPCKSPSPPEAIADRESRL